MWYLYVLECNDGSYYCGVTTDLDRRLRQHNGLIKGGAKYTRSHRPVKLVIAVSQVDRSTALKAEHAFKSLGSHEKKRSWIDDQFKKQRDNLRLLASFENYVRASDTTDSNFVRRSEGVITIISNAVLTCTGALRESKILTDAQRFVDYLTEDFPSYIDSMTSNTIPVGTLCSFKLSWDVPPNDKGLCVISGRPYYAVSGVICYPTVTNTGREFTYVANELTIIKLPS